MCCGDIPIGWVGLGFKAILEAPFTQMCWDHHQLKLIMMTDNIELEQITHPVDVVLDLRAVQFLMRIAVWTFLLSEMVMGSQLCPQNHITYNDLKTDFTFWHIKVCGASLNFSRGEDHRIEELLAALRN